MCLKDHDLSLLHELHNFMQSFAQRTDLVTSGLMSLSLISLIRAEIADACKIGVHDCDELRSLKNFLLKNIDRRLPVSDGISLTTLLDLSTKILVNQAK